MFRVLSDACGNIGLKERAHIEELTADQRENGEDHQRALSSRAAIRADACVCRGTLPKNVRKMERKT